MDYQLNTLDYSVSLPIDLSSPPQILFTVSFFCNGVSFTSPTFDNGDDALIWAQNTLGAFGTWSLDNNVLTVTGTTCSTGVLSVQSTTIADEQNQNNSISLLTANQQAANSDVWCFSALHIGYTGNPMTTRDILTPEFKAIITNLKAKALQYAGGAIAKQEQVLVGETNYLVGGGYHCSDCSFGDGECCPDTPFTVDFFLQTVELCKEVGIRLDVVANIQLPDGTWQSQIEWKITHATNQGVTPKHIMLGQEEVTSGDDVYWLGFPATTNTDYTNKAIAYITKAAPELSSLVSANPTKNFYLDTALIEENGSRDTLWNPQLQGYTNQGFRQYFNLNNLLSNPSVTLSSTDWQANLTKINTAVFTTAVTRLNNFHAAYPTKKMGVWQWGLRNPNSSVNLEDTILGLLFQGKFIKMMLDYNFSNDDLISYASYQDLKQFIDQNNVVSNQGLGLMLIGQLFTGTPTYVPITLNLGSNVSGIAVVDSGTYRILLINDGSQIGSSDDGIFIDGTLKTSWTRESYFGDSLSTKIFNHETITEHSVYAPANSISMLTIT